MTWFALQSLFLILGAFVLGVAVGWLGWGRQERQETIVVLHGDGTTPRTMTRPVEPDPVTAPVGTDETTAPPALPAEPTPVAAGETAAEATPEPTWLRAREPEDDAGSSAVAIETTDDADETDDGAEPDPGTPDAEQPDTEPEVRATDADPEMFNPEAAEPEAVEPEAADPEPAEPAEPEAAEPEAPAAEARDDAPADHQPGVVDLREPAPQVVDLRDQPEATTDEPADEAATDDEGGTDDDLERIEGITPKIAHALGTSGIHGYAELAACDEFRLRGILRSAGLRFAPSLPSWPEQAELLAEGDDEGFAELSARVAADHRTAGTA